MVPPTNHPGNDGIILTHAILIALTPLIPLPIADDMAKGYLERRLVQSLADTHRLRLWSEEVSTLANEATVKTATGMLKSAALLPVKFIVRKLFVLLTSKKVVELASEHYHRGLLLDLAFREHRCAPSGPHSPKTVRRAVDKVLQTLPVAQSPVTTALRSGFQQSQVALSEAVKALRLALVKLRNAPSAEELEHAIDDATELERSDLADIVTHVRESMKDVPQQHFRRMEEQLRAHLPLEPGALSATDRSRDSA